MSFQSVFRPDLFKGKVVFVTGGGTGICYTITEYLMQHGASAMILGRRSEVITKAASTLSQSTGQKCIGVAGDVRKPDSLKAAVAQCVKEFGKIDFVISGAAGNFLSPLDGMSENAFNTVMQIDTQGTFNLLKATIEEVKKTKGAYIAISATLHYKATFLQAHVSAAKAAIDALFKVAALEYGPFGIRFNIVAPGPIEGTEGMSRLLPKDMEEDAIRSIPMGRYGTKEEIAAACAYLFSPMGTYNTASTIVVDGGEWHNSSMGRTIGYPEALLAGGDFRKTIAARL